MSEPHPAVPVLEAIVESMDTVLRRHQRIRESVSMRRGVLVAWQQQAQEALQLLHADPTADAARQAAEARQTLRVELTSTLTAVCIYESLLLDLRERLAAHDTTQGR